VIKPPPQVVQPPIGATLRTVVVEAIVIIPSPTYADLYTLLQCGENSEYGRKAYGGYIKVFWAETDESSPLTSGNF
jgi:hypothetical protein